MMPFAPGTGGGAISGGGAGAAATPAAAAAAAPAAAPPKEEKTHVDIKLVSFDAKNKIKVIKEVRAATSLGLKEVRQATRDRSLAITDLSVGKWGLRVHSCSSTVDISCDRHCGGPRVFVRSAHVVARRFAFFGT